MWEGRSATLQAHDHDTTITTTTPGGGEVVRLSSTLYHHNAALTTTTWLNFPDHQSPPGSQLTNTARWW
ncbi:hypothetical protein E2C01_008935 [Portunus trituberculatus]|uniref:Uncharacterized protein n=1 Tax=Portunus trituberculatus TaxID=210409 RepID=A0A5B7D243_PORTR|nr:hypothetical protein [Portunus trituberculatus]